MSPFKERVIGIIRKIPYGTVASYGQIALYVGLPRSARQVGWILNQTEGKIDIPWWRIINNKGYLSIRGTMVNTKNLQRKLLRAEGVEVSEDFMVDMNIYRFVADTRFLKESALSDEYIQKIIEKFGVSNT